jgi:hypothetical protein
MSAVQAVVTPTGAPPNYGTPQPPAGYGAAYTPAPIAPTANVGAPQFAAPPASAAPLLPPPPGPAPTAPVPGPPHAAPSYGTPQGPYGFQQAPAETAPPAKKSSAGMWIGIIAVVVLLGGTAAAFKFLLTGDDKKDDVATLDAGDKTDKPDKPDKTDKPAVDAKKADPDNDGDGDGDKDGDGDGSADPWANAGASDADVKALLADVTNLKNKMCACTDQACIGQVTAGAGKLADQYIKLGTKLADPKVAAKLAQVQAEMQQCAMRLAGGGIKPTRPTDNSINAQFDRLADRACACKNAACGNQVLTDLTTWARSIKDKDDGDEERAKVTAVRMAQCLIAAGVDKQTIANVFTALGSS